MRNNVCGIVDGMRPDDYAVFKDKPRCRVGKIFNANVAQAFQPVIFLTVKPAGWKARPTKRKAYGQSPTFSGESGFRGISDEVEGIG
jgi:hypothetical protein